ncbi:DoxX family protein [Saccharomonospora viridis]|jgi:hypothetical protein|uniref:DoxX-like family protein n=2 Tax=Saccharomonospora viridis TaxID=1852 RepID=C7MWP6_SACVD|nr:DoxX family protein [Saccharomonospora viridis]ACU97150.1 hypothetical protein Svir_21380 [Saccharomonospora viridis DSM 43017]KHF43399.1 membrane protein [Saccharomonospora viridis]SFO79551.1 DoxX-like family protein [Saccharomonospora viridis]
MVVESVPQWPSIVLAVVLFGDAVMSVKPPRFIQRCLDGVNFPRDWWWALIYIKLIAAAGLIVGLFVAGVGIAANVGVIAYFVAAAYAHIRAKFLKSEFWINCLGMLALSIATLLVTVLV